MWNWSSHHLWKEMGNTRDEIWKVGRVVPWKGASCGPNPLIPRDGEPQQKHPKLGHAIGSQWCSGYMSLWFVKPCIVAKHLPSSLGVTSENLNPNLKMSLAGHCSVPKETVQYPGEVFLLELPWGGWGCSLALCPVLSVSSPERLCLCL